MITEVHRNTAPQMQYQRLDGLRAPAVAATALRQGRYSRLAAAAAPRLRARAFPGRRVLQGVESAVLRQWLRLGAHQ